MCLSEQRISHPVFARYYARVSPAMDKGGMAEHRQQLLQGLTGARLFEATIGPALGGGCHTGRDTAAAIQAAGFTIDHLDPFRFPDSRLTMPATPHLRGTATRNR
jgi:hypothetical protein